MFDMSASLTLASFKVTSHTFHGELKWVLSGRGTKANLVRAGAELGEYNRKMAQEAAARDQQLYGGEGVTQRDRKVS